MVDAAGFTGFYFAEHHGTDLCMAPNQDLMIAAASQVTSSIRLGPMVKLLPLHHPIQTIEDICVLDNLTGGRLEWGVGRGIAPVEHYWFGGDWPTARERHEDCLLIIARALREGVVSSEGTRHYDFRPMPMATFPVQSHIPFWTPNNPEAAGRYGFKLMCAGPPTQRMYDLYLENWYAYKDDPIRFDGPGDEPTVGTTMVVAIDRDEATARDAVARAMRGLGRRTTAVHQWDAELIGQEAADFAMKRLRGLLDSFERIIESGSGGGTPSKMIDHFGAVIETGLVDHLVIQVPTGDMTFEEARTTLELFCSDVMPALDAA